MADLIYDVIIVGAGISGLCAARKLSHNNNASVLVLEARDRVGGRIYTKQFSDLGWVDVGGSYTGPAQKNITNLAKELCVQTHNVYDKGQSVFFFKGEALTYRGSGWPHKRLLEWLDCNHAFRSIDTLSKQVPPENPCLAKYAKSWDQMTVQQWIDHVCWTRAAKEWMRQFVVCNVTVEPCEVSFLWFLCHISSAGGVDSIWEVAGAAQDMKFQGGSQQICEKMAENLKGSVKLKCPVNKIHQAEEGTVVYTTDGSSFKCRYVILAMPPNQMHRIQYEPALPPLKSQLLQRIPMGSCIKTETWYEKAFWREKGFNGVTSSADNSVMVGNTMDDTQEDSIYPALTGFIMGDMARAAIKLTKEERKQKTLECHAKFFGTSEALKCVGYEEYNWMGEPWTGGGYTSIYPPGVLTKYGNELRTPFRHIYFAGTETAVHWCGYMDGAVEAGYRVAGQILNQIGKKNDGELQPKHVPDEDDSPNTFYSLLEKYAPSVGEFLTGSAVVLVVLAGSCFWVTYRKRLWMRILTKTSSYYIRKVPYIPQSIH